MDASQNCIDLIHGSEGFKIKLPDGRYKAYLDTLPKTPVPTIYCGLTKGVTMSTVWTVQQCEKAFSKEMSFYEDAIERMVTVPLNQNQFDALVSLVYNIGPGDPAAKRAEDKKGFYWSTLRALLNQGKYEEAALQFKRYKYSGGVVYNGLITRRAKEAALFLKPMPDEALAEHEELPPIPQVVDHGPVQSVGSAIKSSPSTQLTSAGILGTIYMWWQSATGYGVDVVKEAGPIIIDTQKDLGPFSAIFKLTPSVVAFLTISVLAAVAIRQIMKRYNGTSV